MYWLLLTAALGQSSAPAPVDLETRSGLENLRYIAATADVFGIGESIHGSTGLETARFAAAQTAIEDLGFEAVAIEISWVEARQVDAAIQQCASGASLDHTHSTLPKTWDGYRPLLDILCKRRHTHPIRVFGIDITDPWSARDILETRGRDATLREHCFGAQFDSARELSDWGTAHGYPTPTRRDHRTCLRHLKARQRQSQNEDEALAAASIMANQRRIWPQYVRNDITAAYTIREEAMTVFFHYERVRLGLPRTVLLAHDEHVARTPGTYWPIGGNLTKQLNYANLSVDGYRVETRLGARFDPSPPDPGSQPHQWAQLEGPAVLVVHPGKRHDGTLYLDYAERGP
jgi:erythromycin esterase-like protein